MSSELSLAIIVIMLTCIVDYFVDSFSSFSISPQLFHNCCNHPDSGFNHSHSYNHIQNVSIYLICLTFLVFRHALARLEPVYGLPFNNRITYFYCYDIAMTIAVTLSFLQNNLFLSGEHDEN